MPADVNTQKKSVVLLSGGLDSATVLALARAGGFRCHALSVDYGQRHAAELAAELSPGPGSFKVKLFDCLEALDEPTLAERRRVSG